MWVYFNEPEHDLLSKCFINVEDALNFLIEQIKIKAPLEDQDFLIHKAIRNKEEHLRENDKCFGIAQIGSVCYYEIDYNTLKME